MLSSWVSFTILVQLSSHAMWAISSYFFQNGQTQICPKGPHWLGPFHSCSLAFLNVNLISLSFISSKVHFSPLTIMCVIFDPVLRFRFILVLKSWFLTRITRYVLTFKAKLGKLLILRHRFGLGDGLNACAMDWLTGCELLLQFHESWSSLKSTILLVVHPSQSSSSLLGLAIHKRMDKRSHNS